MRRKRLFVWWLCSCLTFALASSNIAAAAHTAIIDTYVGGGNGDGDAAINATIDPRGMALTGSASAPNIYVADGLNHRVRRFDGASGVITTIAGTGASGFSGDGGQGQDARLWIPTDVAVDGAGNVYIADMMNNRIRKVATDGQISTFAGNGQGNYSGDNGLATQAGVYQPAGVAVGRDGNVYIADSGNNRIRKVSPPGCSASTCVITTVAGTAAAGAGGDDGPATSAPLHTPTDVVFDGFGNMYICDYVNSRVRRVASNGIITTVAGGGQYGPGGTIGDGGPGTLAVLNNPVQIATDSSGNVYIADNVGKRIRMLQANTFIISTVAGTGGSGTSGDGGAATSATIYAPAGVAATTAGTFWFSQSTNVSISSSNRVRKVTAFATIQSVIGGGLGDGGAPSNALVDPRGGEAVDAGGALPDLYFADGNNNVVRRVDGTTGIINNIAGTGVAGYSGDHDLAIDATLHGPLDVAVDAVHRLVYIADTTNNVIRRVDAGGLITTVAGSGGYGFNGDGPATQTSLAEPRGIALDQFGNVYIADHDNYRVRKLHAGQITTVAGTGHSGSSGDGGPATAAWLAPWDVVVAEDGSLYVSDYDDNRVRKIDTNGVISTYAGGYNSGFGGDGGPANQAKLAFPSNLALDAEGNLFIADSLNNRVRRVDAVSRKISTVAGDGLPGTTGDGGAATAANLGQPSGVAVDPSGRWAFVSVRNEERVRAVDFGPACAIVEPPQRSDLWLSLWLLGPLVLLRGLRARQAFAELRSSTDGQGSTGQP